MKICLFTSIAYGLLGVGLWAQGKIESPAVLEPVPQEQEQEQVEDAPSESKDALLALPEAQFKILESDYFLVVAEDFDSGQYVRNLGMEMAELGQRYLKVPQAFHPPVLFEVVPAHKADFTAPYKVHITAKGEVVVSIAWGEQTQLDMLCQAVARGFLLRWAIGQYGLGVKDQTPAWLHLAMGVRLQVGIRPLFREKLKTASLDLPTLTLEEVIAPEATSQHDLGLLEQHAYWLFRMLETSALDRGQFRIFLSDILRGRPTLDAMNEHLITDDSIEDTVLWWAVGFQNAVRQNYFELHGLEHSGAFLTQFETLVVDVNGEDVDLGLREIWQYRHKNTVKAAIRWRLLEVKMALHSINPVYYNSLHSLGIIYESYLGRDAEYFLELEKMYQKDRAEADALSVAIIRELNKVSQKNF